MQQEKRSLYRTEADVPVQLNATTAVAGALWHSDGLVTNLSGCGARVLVPARLTEGRKLECGLVLPDTQPIHAIASVVHTRPIGSRYMVGLQFLGLSRNEQEAIVRYVFVKQREQLRRLSGRR